jgi:hypothetical protein
MKCAIHCFKTCFGAQTSEDPKLPISPSVEFPPSYPSTHFQKPHDDVPSSTHFLNDRDAAEVPDDAQMQQQNDHNLEM